MANEKGSWILHVVGALGTITTEFEKYIKSLGIEIRIDMFRNQHCQEQLE